MRTSERTWRVDQPHPEIERRLAAIAPLETDCGAVQMQEDGRIFLGGCFTAAQLRQLAQVVEDANAHETHSGPGSRDPAALSAARS